MPITDDIKKTLSETLNDPTPLYALAGAGDLAYEKLREVPGRVEALAADRKGTQEKATARLQEAQAKLVEAQGRVVETVSTLPTDLKVLQEKAQTFALQQVGRAAEFAVKAKEVYDELAVRGKSVVEAGPGGAERPAAEESAVIDVEVTEVAEVAIDPEVAVDPEDGGPAAESAEEAAPAKKSARARKGTSK